MTGTRKELPTTFRCYHRGPAKGESQETPAWAAGWCAPQAGLGHLAESCGGFCLEQRVDSELTGRLDSP